MKDRRALGTGTQRGRMMTRDSHTSFDVVLRYLEQLKDSDEARESAEIAPEADEIRELRAIVEETQEADCVEFATT